MIPTPDGCRHDGIAQRDHANRWHPDVRWHQWQPPTDAQRLERMRERAALRRFEEALAHGLSEYEAREDGWPTTQSSEEI